LTGRLQGCGLVALVDEPGWLGLQALLPVRAHTVVSEVVAHLTTCKTGAFMPSQARTALHAPTVEQQARDGQDSKRNPASRGYLLSFKCRHVHSSTKQGDGQDDKRKPARDAYYLLSEQGTKNPASERH
jgi:hypothetical protein